MWMNYLWIIDPEYLLVFLIIKQNKLLDKILVIVYDNLLNVKK